jgi:hypothetical protein
MAGSGVVVRVCAGRRATDKTRNKQETKDSKDLGINELKMGD